MSSSKRKSCYASVKPRRGISLKRTAYHEAGHAAMAVWLRVRCRNVSIVPDEQDNSLGHMLKGKTAKVEPEARHLNSKTRWQLERLALVSLAGNAAEQLLTSHKCNEGSQQDFHQVVEYLSYLAPREEEMRAYFHWLQERAKTILSESWNWFAVETLANELVQCKYIGGKKAFHIIRKAWKDSCPDY